MCILVPRPWHEIPACLYRPGRSYALHRAREGVAPRGNMGVAFVVLVLRPQSVVRERPPENNVCCNISVQGEI